MAQAVQTPPPSRSLAGDASRLAGGSAWVFAGRLAFGLSAVLQNVVLARLLAPADLGAFLLAQSLFQRLNNPHQWPYRGGF